MCAFAALSEDLSPALIVGLLPATSGSGAFMRQLLVYQLIYREIDGTCLG